MIQAQACQNEYHSVMVMVEENANTRTVWKTAFSSNLETDR